MVNSTMGILLYITAVFLSITYTNGLYEDQIGKFDWHQKYFGPIRFILNDLNQPKRIIVGTENNIIGAVNSNNGAILYRNILESNGKLVYLGHFEDKQILAISLYDKQVKIRSFLTSNGIEKKEWILQEDITHATEYNYKVYLISTKPLETTITTVQINDKNENDKLEGNLNIIDTKNIKTKQTDFCDVATPYFICINKKSLSIIELENGIMNQITLDDDIIEMSTSGSIGLTVIILKGKTFIKLFHIQNQSGSPELIPIEYNPIGHFITISQSKIDDKYILFISYLETSHRIQMDGLSLITSTNKLEKDDKFSIQIQSPNTMISSLLYTKGFCYNLQCGFVGFTKDEYFFGTKLNGKSIEWSRQESLSTVLSIEMVDYPNELERSWNPYIKQMDIFTSFISRIKYEIETIFSNEIYSSGDQFGLKKVIVIITSIGKVIGMDSTNGQILYTFVLPEFSKYPQIFFYIQRPAKYTPLKPLASIIYKSSINSNTILFPFNPIEGKHLDEPQIFPPIITSQILLHGNEMTNYLKPILLLDSNLNIHTYPNSIPKMNHTYFFLATHDESPTLKGFAIKSAERNKLKAKQLWDINLGNSELLGVYGKLPCEKIHSQGRVLPDRSVSYKYMNPNMVVVVTSENGNINLFFIDAVSGAVIHSFWHKKCRGPVHVVHSEHWIIYSLYNDKFRRYEINSVELYEGQTQSNATAFSSFAAPSVHPIIVKQAYIFPTGIQYMAHTRTEKGITNKDILIGLATGGVLELPRMILQPRLSQQHYLTQVQDEDGNFHSMPYIPELPVPADMIINYNQSVRRITGIKTWPTRLESTCLVLVYGNDLFYTKVSPSKTFDVLKDDFDHWFITVVLAALCLGAYLTKRLSARKQLEQAWR